MQFPIHIELRRSRLLVFFLLLFHALATACVIALAWPWPLRSLLLVLIAVSAWHNLRPQKIIGLRLAGDGGLDCLFAGGERTATLVLPDSTVFNHLIVLRLRVGDLRCVVSLVLLPGSISVEQFRVLRLWLRWCGKSGAKNTMLAPSESTGKGV